MTTCPCYHSKCTHSSQVNHRLGPWIGKIRDFSTILVVPTTIGCLFHYGRFGFALLSVCQFWYSLDPLSVVIVSVFIMTRSEITYRPFKSETSQVHEWVVYRLGGILDLVGHRKKIHKITPTTGKERGDLEHNLLRHQLHLCTRTPTVQWSLMCTGRVV